MALSTSPQQDTETTPSADPLRWAAVSHPLGANVSLETGDFDHALSATDDNVQTALATLDEHQPPATRVTVADAGFDGNLAPGDDTVQKVAAKVDALELTAVAETTEVIADTREDVNSADIDSTDDNEVFDTTATGIGFSLPPEGTTKIRFRLGAQAATARVVHPEEVVWDFDDYMLLVESTNLGTVNQTTGLTEVHTPGSAGDTAANGTFARLRVFQAQSTTDVGSNADPVDLFIGRKADGGMLVAPGLASEDAIPLTVVWVVRKAIDVVTGIVGVEAGQESPGDATTNGNTFLRLYQWEASGTTPADPPDQWENGAFRTSFGDWNDEPGLASNSAQVLWVSNGGTSLDDDGFRQNRAWQKYASLTEQYAKTVQDSSTYTLDATTAGVRFVRSLLPTGWGVWKLIEDGTGGWITLVEDKSSYSSGLAATVQQYNIDDDLDAEYFRELEIEVYAFGQLVDGAPDRIGWGGIKRFYRKSGNWTTKYQDETVSHAFNLGAYKVNCHDKRGVSVMRAYGPNSPSEMSSNQGPVLTDYPWRRINFLLHLIATTATQPNLISRIHIGPFAGSGAFSRVTVRMR